MMRASGHTLVELLIAVAVLAVVAAAALPLAAPVNANKLDAAVQEVASALRYARGEALRTGQIYGVDFSVDAAAGYRRIRVFRTDSAVPPNPVYDVRHPLDKKLYDVQLVNGTGTQGATLSTATFTYYRFPLTWIGRDWAAFNANGNPDYYPDATNYMLVANFPSPTQLAVTLAEKSRTVSVDATTGRVTVQ